MTSPELLRAWKIALDEEVAARNEAFLELPLAICGEPIRPLTTRLFLVLLSIRSPFVCRGEKTAAEVARFLWAMSPEFEAPPARNAEDEEFLSRKSAFLRRVGALPFAKTKAAIEEYLDVVFMDAPGSDGSGGGSVPKTSFAAAIIDCIARAYGWSRNEILDAPLVQIYQHMRRIALRENPKAILFNRRSDRAKRAWQRSLNPDETAATARPPGRRSATPPPPK